MEIDLSDLLEILGKQKRLIDELLVLASDQLQALKLNDLKKITHITGQQEYISRQLALLEQKRQVILEQYSRKLEIKLKHFSELRLYTNKRDFEMLQKIRNEIIESSQILKKSNELNSLLLKQGLRYAEKILAILNNNNSLVYGKSGNIRTAGSNGTLDTNV